MDNIIDLTDGGDAADVLDSTGTGGLLGGKLLQDRPLSAYLDDDEDVQYVLRNKKSGLDVAAGFGVDSVEPDGDYQALAAVTDRRLLVVVGKSAGDETRSLPFTDVLETRVGSGGLRTSVLEIETLEEETWKFPCKDDPGQVATYIEDVAQTWANADRLLDDVETQIVEAREHLDDGEQDAATAALEGASETVTTARERIDALGPGPREAVHERADEIEVRLAETTRRVAASRGASAHASAQDAWERGEYEQAARDYEQAVESYETALDRDGATPPEASLARRLRGAVGERELLRAGPLVDADAARRKAERLVDPEDAAQEWERALDAYRDMLGLDWPGDRTFLADRERIQQHATEIAGDAIADHREAGRKWLSAGDELFVEGREGQAEHVYERAREQFQRAHALASEVRPERADDLAEDVEIAEKRVAGEGIPEEKPDETVLPSDDESDEDGTADGATGDGTPTDDRGQDAVGRTPGTTSTAVPQDTEGSLIDQIKSNKKRQGTASTAAASGGVGTDSDDATTDSGGDDAADSESASAARDAGETTASTDESGETSTEHGDGRTPATASDDAGQGDGTEQAPTGEGGQTESPGPDLSVAEIRDHLAALDEETFTTFVADVWEAQGWSTTVFSATAKAVYDIMAMRKEPEENRLLLWTVHRPDGGALGVTVIKRCATARDSSQGADSATLVTTGSLTDAARRQAEELDVTVVDSEKLADIIRFEGLERRLVEVADAD